MPRSCILLLLPALLLAGCPVPQPQDTPVHEQREIDPVTGRGYWLYVPSTYSPDRPMRVVVTCHGTWPYDVASHHVREWKMLGERNDCIIVAPSLRGTDGIFRGGPTRDMLADERYILSILSLLGYRYNIDRNNIMITGFSGGGFPMYWVGLRHPEIFSVIAARNCNFSTESVAGWWPEHEADREVLVYYGQLDPSTIRNQSREAIEYLRRHGVSVQERVIEGAGHSRRPEYAMEFFNEHRRPARPSQPAATARR